MSKVMVKAREFVSVLRFAVVFILLCGLLYPLLTTALAGVMFPQQARGNLITIGNDVVGSRYVGQKFTNKMFLWSRPSAYEYNMYMVDKDGVKTLPSGQKFEGAMTGSDNMALSNPALQTREQKELNTWLKSHPYLKASDIPSELLTQSGSGIDPDISPQAARIQIKRISGATGLSEEEVQKIISRHITPKWLGIFGEPHVNVLAVNLDLYQTLFKK